MLKTKDYQKIISSRHRLFDLHLRETFSRRNLIFLFVKRDLVASYKQTVLGPVWFLIVPIISTLLFTVIFGDLAGLPTLDAPTVETVPAFLFYMAGNILWSLFSSTFLLSSCSFRTNAPLMGKIYFPRIIAPISSALSNLITFALQFVLFAVLYFFCFFTGRGDMALTPRLLLLLPTVLELLLFAVGCGIIVSSFTTKYRDLSMMVNILVRFWQYATPVLYGLTLVSEKKPDLLCVYMLNPMTPIVTTFRYAVFGFGYFNLTYYLVGWGLTLAVFIVGLILFSRIERSFIDTV